MSYTALYRVYRPGQWEDVVNQKPVIRILQNALAENKVSHAYLFSGPRGTGKTTVARLLAKAVNCRDRKGTEPCNHCEPCQSIASGSSVDVIEIDAASNRGIDEIRSLRESVRYLPVMGKLKVYIIDEVHMLTPEAFNALLKTLEEPPEHVMFIMATTAAHKIPVTIASRCQRLEFRQLSIEDIEGQMEKILTAQKVSWETEALRLIARAAGGSMRDGLSILDLCITYGDGQVLEKDAREILGQTSGEVMASLFWAISKQDLKKILDTVTEISSRGKDMGELCQEIAVFARDLLFISSGGDPSRLGRTQDEIRDMASLSNALSNELLIQVLEASSKAVSLMRNSDDHRLVVDAALLGLFAESETRSKTGSKISGKTSTPEFAQAKEDREVKPQKLKQTTQRRKIEHESLKQKAIEQESPEQKGIEQKSIERDSFEQAEPKPEPVVPIEPGGLYEAVVKVWDNLLAELQKARKIQARAYLLPAKPFKIVDDKVLVLAYPEGYATHMEQILVSNHKKVVQEHLERLIDRRLDIAVEVEQPGQTYDSGGSDGNGDFHPLVKAAIDMIDGKVNI